MKPINLGLPNEIRVSGDLLEDYSNCPQWLTQDILQAYLPTGQTIDVGWWPEFDLAGSFKIVVCEGNWDNQIEPPVFAATPQAAAAKIREIVARFSRPKPVKNSRAVQPS